MSTTTHTPTTKREVLIAREAYAYATVANAVVARNVADRWAAEKYPLPKVKRLRVVEDKTSQTGTTYWWRVADGRLEYSSNRAHWTPLDGCGMYINLGRVQLLAELLANPTEEVEEE